MQLKIVSKAYTPWAKKPRGWDIFLLKSHNHDIHLGKYFDCGWFFYARFEFDRSIYYLDIAAHGTRYGRIDKKDVQRILNIFDEGE